MKNVAYLAILMTIVGVFYSSLPAKPRQKIFEKRVELKNFDLVDPEEAPEEVREEVMQGYRLIMETKKYAKEYVGNQLNCTNCHFDGGNSLGGKNGSISLVGVTYVYPQERGGEKIDLAQRINSCFIKSMNGRPMPHISPEMKAMITYLYWISEPVKDEKEFPWMGLPQIVGSYEQSAERGKEVYAKNCAICHGENGQGSKLQKVESMLDIPPLWGEGSFNNGAGMNHISMIAPFVYLNMPYQNSDLTEEEAMDVAQYVIEQSRPTFHAPTQ